MTERKLQRIRQIRTSDWNYVYLDVELKFPTKSNAGGGSSEIGVREFKLIILSSIESLFGEFGHKMLFDILKYRFNVDNDDNNNCRAYIRVSAKDYIKFRLSLTLHAQWNGMPCHFNCFKACHSLASLSISPQCPIDSENIHISSNNGDGSGDSNLLIDSVPVATLENSSLHSVS